jgi:hypothetical protein
MLLRERYDVLAHRTIDVDDKRRLAARVAFFDDSG